LQVLNIASGAKLKLTSGTLSVKGPVVNDDNTNGVYSDGTLELNGTSAQTISGTGLFHNVKINNANGVSLSSGSNNNYRHTYSNRRRNYNQRQDWFSGKMQQITEK